MDCQNVDHITCMYFYTILLKMNLFRKINSGLFFYKKKFEQCLEEKKPDLDIDSGVSKIRWPFLCKKHTYLTLPPQRWHLSPVQPGLQIQFPLEVSQNPLDVHGFEHGKVGNGVVVATLISEGVCCILSISWSEDPITDRMRIKTKKVHSNQDFLSTMVFKLFSKVGGRQVFTIFMNFHFFFTWLF